MQLRRAVVVSLVSSLALTTAHAQTGQRFSVQLSGLYATVGADVFATVESGLGAEGQLRMTNRAFSVGLGGQFTRHGIESDVIGNLNLYGVFLEPRYVIAVSSDTYAPYISARVSFLRGTIDGDVGTVESNGAQFNAGGGILLKLTDQVNLDFGATYGRLNFGTITKNIDGEEFEQDGGGGGNLVLRVGFSFGIGGGSSSRFRR
jgi:hypothetical protein